MEVQTLFAVWAMAFLLCFFAACICGKDQIPIEKKVLTATGTLFARISLARVSDAHHPVVYALSFWQYSFQHACAPSEGTARDTWFTFFTTIIVGHARG